MFKQALLVCGTHSEKNPEHEIQTQGKNNIKEGVESRESYGL